MKKYKITYTDKAKKDLREIVFYIDKTLDAYVTAMNMFESLTKKIEEISNNPYIYPLFKDSRNINNVRKAIIKKHLIFYIISEESKEIIIVRIMNGRRNWKRII